MKTMLAAFILVSLRVPSCTCATESKKIVIEERLIIPAAGCDHGEPVPNMMLPTKGGPTPRCLPETSETPSVSLPDRHAEKAEEVSVEVGTVVIMALSTQQVMVSADSRNGYLKLPGPQFSESDDNGCKLVEAGPSLLFAATGQTQTAGTLPGDIYYDAQALAREIGQKCDGQAISEIAAQWAWEVAFRIRRGLKAGAYRPFGRTWLTGIFAGIDPNGDASVAIAQLEYREPRAGFVVPEVGISIRVPGPRNDFTNVEAFGLKQVAEGYYSPRAVTEERRIEHERVRRAQLGDPERFPESILYRLMGLTFKYSTARYPDRSKMVGGKTDLAKIGRDRHVHWLRRKDTCL